MRFPRTTLEQWRVLQTVVDTGGFAQAADTLHRSQSSVSYTVAKLQEQLGVALLELEGRKARLTTTGEMLLRRSRQLLIEAAELEQVANTLDQGWEPEVTLVVDAIFDTVVLIDVLKEFAPLNRGCRVQLKEVVLSGADDALLAGDADLVIGHRVPQGYMGDPIAEIEFIAVAHPDHPLHRLDRELSMHDLTNEMQVVVRDSGIQHRDSGWLGALHRWTVTSIETSVTTISNGLGFGWLPCHRIQEKLTQGTLKPLRLRQGQRRIEVLSMIYGKPENVGPATRLLANMFSKRCNLN